MEHDVEVHTNAMRIVHQALMALLVHLFAGLIYRSEECHFADRKPADSLYSAGTHRAQAVVRTRTVRRLAEIRQDPHLKCS